MPGTRGKEHHTPELQQQCAPQSALPGLKPTCGMEIAGTTAMPSPPPGPGQDQLHTAGRRPDEMTKQMTHFSNGQGKQGSGI